MEEEESLLSLRLFSSFEELTKEEKVSSLKRISIVWNNVRRNVRPRIEGKEEENCLAGRHLSVFDVLLRFFELMSREEELLSLPIPSRNSIPTIVDSILANRQWVNPSIEDPTRPKGNVIHEECISSTNLSSIPMFDL